MFFMRITVCVRAFFAFVHLCVRLRLCQSLLCMNAFLSVCVFVSACCTSTRLYMCVSLLFLYVFVYMRVCVAVCVCVCVCDFVYHVFVCARMWDIGMCLCLRVLNV